MKNTPIWVIRLALILLALAIIAALIEAHIIQVSALAVICGLVVVLLAAGYLFLWHPLRMRQAERMRAFAEAKEIETRSRVLDSTVWREDQAMLHEQQVRERALELDHEFRMAQLKLQFQHHALPIGHNLVILDENRAAWNVIQGQAQAPKQITNNNMGEAAALALYPQPVDFAQVLQSFSPNTNAIYMLNTIDEPVTVPMNKVCHVGLGGSTGGGKTNTTRLLAAQLLRCGAVMYLASPNFAQLKLNGNRLEDWRPIVAHLAAPPAQSDEEIKTLIGKFRTLFEQRKRDEQFSPKRGQDVFLVLGELPGIVKRLPDSVDTITLLLRESRQYGVHIISEFQDALVSTIGGSSGVRENYKTGYYFGGDDKTAKILLDLANGVKIEEVGLGDKGAAYLRSQSNKARAGRVPFLSNRALYMLLGEPPDPMGDDLIEYEDQVPNSYCHVNASGRYEDTATGAGSTIVESVPLTRSGEPETPHEVAIVGRDQARQTGPLGTLYAPINATLETRQEEDYARLTDEQVIQFKALYKVRQNIDYNLKIIGAGSTRYRQHARVIIQEIEKG